ncbi:hypothetical protein [Methanobrevibacter sp.]|uniref:hypothetical protein n=1 Tax=Methanobrevibacter sp. TaxID=66852 RepID=UPI0026DF2596|nr:hypothetical protein [Methanobrevibacter sp.]
MSKIIKRCYFFVRVEISHSYFGEIGYNGNNDDLDEKLLNALVQTDNLFEINIDFEF